MKPFLFEYRHRDAWWGLTIEAEDAADATARLRALAFAQMRGEVVATIPVPGGTWLLRAARFARRFFSTSRENETRPLLGRSRPN
jgi:hypothetical protein